MCLSHRILLIGALLLVVSRATTALAQPADPAPATEEQARFTGQIEIVRLLDVAAERLKIRIEYDPGALKGSIALRGEALSNDEIWRLTNRALAAQGLTTIRAGAAGSFAVVKITDAANLAPMDSNIEPSAPEPGFKTVSLRSRFVPAKTLAADLGKVLAKGPGTITTVGDDLLIIADLSERIRQIEMLLAAMDTEGAQTVMEEVSLRHLSATQAITVLAQINAKREVVGGDRPRGEVLAGSQADRLMLVAPKSSLPRWRELIAAIDRREQVDTHTYSTGLFPARDVAKLIEQVARGAGPTDRTAGVDDRWRLVIDELTESLLITATPTQHASVEEILGRLRQVPASARRPVRTFTIKNRPIDEVVSILTDLLNAGSLSANGGDDSEAPGGSTSAPSIPPVSTAAIAGDSAVFPMPPPPIGAGSSASSRRPSAAASASAVSRGRAGDEPPVTFTIDKGTSTLIAIGEPRTLDQIAALLKTLDVRQPQVMLEVLLVTLTDGQTMDLGVELEKLEVSGGTLIRLSSLFGLGSRGEGGDRDGPANASGFTGVVLNPGDFSIVLRALETLNEGRAMSMPKLLVGNNEQATLDSVIQQPFASVNASNTVSTTSFGGTQDAGTVVTIQPQIAEGDHLLLQYSVSLSAFLGPASSPTLPPPRQQNRVQSVATIPDGFSVVVGGIEIQNNSQAVSQIPFLGSIPIIGEVFKSRNNADSKSTFYVFIRANVLRHGGFEDLKYLSETDVAKAGVDDGWPELKPRVIR